MNFIKSYGWTFIVLTAIGGLWVPHLGLLIIPMMLSLMVLGIFKGKYWCGNICPHGNMFDLYIGLISLNKKMPKPFKFWLVRLLAFSWFGYMMIARISRIVPLWGEMSFWEQLGTIFVVNYLMVTIVGTVLAVVIRPRTWCSVCPMGTMQKLTYSLGNVTGINKNTDSKVTMSQPEKCLSCWACARSCPMELVPFKNLDQNHQFSDSDCIRCQECVVACPVNVLEMSTINNGNKELQRGTA